MEPLAMKYRAVKMSPGWTNVSPGGACVDLNLVDRTLRQPEESDMKEISDVYYPFVHSTKAVYSERNQ